MGERNIRQGGVFMLPQDPIILLSYLNTRLRDQYPSLDALCEDMEVNLEEILQKMAGIDYVYDRERNQFR